jgi:hypothetical protein
VLVSSAPSPAWSQDTLQHAYVTGAPVPDWLGLATQSGRDAIRLGEGFSGVAPGVNVLQEIAEVPDDEAVGLTLQVVDPVLGVQAEVCTVIERLHMSDVPCARNADGVCDVAHS